MEMQLLRNKTGDGDAGHRKQQKNKSLGKQITNKLSSTMYEIQKVLKNKDYKNINKAAQKSIADSKKKLMNYEKQAKAATSEGKDIDCTLDQVAVAVKEASHAVTLVNKLIETHALGGNEGEGSATGGSHYTAAHRTLNGDGDLSDRSPGSLSPISNNARSIADGDSSTELGLDMGWTVEGFFPSGEQAFTIENFAADASIGHLKMRLRNQAIDYTRWYAITVGEQYFTMAHDYTKFMATRVVEEHANRLLRVTVTLH